MKASLPFSIIIAVLSALLLFPFSASALKNYPVPKYPVSGPQGGISMKVTLPDGFDLQKDTSPVVILMHGIFSSKDFAPMPKIASHLASKGYASIRFDFGGHGKSQGKKVNMTIAKELEEAMAVWNYAKGLPFASSIYVLGHSQGGVVASMLSGMLSEEGDDVPRGLILLAPGEVIKEATQAGKFFGKAFDPKNPPEYIKCFNIYKLGRDYLTQTQELDIYGTSAPYKGPVKLIHGSKDTIVPLWCSEKYVETYGEDRATLDIIEGEGHTLIKKTGEVCDAISAFLDSVQSGKTK